MNFKQTLFVQYYTEGETKGNCEQSMLKAGYKSKYARGHCGTFLVANSCVQKAIKEAIEMLKIAWTDRINKVIARLQKEMDNTTSISSLCLLVNAQKGYMDMQAKNQGEYGADNAQRTEQVKLDQVHKEEAQRIAKILNLEDARKGKAG
jgi:phage terminase small subunit